MTFIPSENTKKKSSTNSAGSSHGTEAAGGSLKTEINNRAGSYGSNGAVSNGFNGTKSNGSNEEVSNGSNGAESKGKTEWETGRDLNGPSS